MSLQNSAQMRVGVLAALMSERFTVVRELGGRAAATVLLAMDRRLEREVAVKVFEPGTMPGDHERFDREILLTARLRHPLIVPVIDHGIIRGHPFYVMPFIPDETLRAMLLRVQRIEVSEAVRIALDLCESLAFAHASGVIHRDVKPENVFSNAFHTQLTDFGIATASGSAEGLRLTESGVVHGTATYMSPEQGLGRHDLDGRSDLYALGCVIWEMLVGEPPYHHPNVMQLVTMHQTAPIPDLRLASACAPRTLVSLLRALLAKSRTERPTTAAEVHEQLMMVRNEITGALSLPVATPTPRSMEALSPSMMATRQGRTLLARGVAGGAGAAGAAQALNVARVYFERALVLDGTNQAARLGLAEVTEWLGLAGTGSLDRAKRESTALRMSAVQSADASAEVLAVLAETLLYWEDDVAAAGRNIARALALEPDHPGALRLHGVWLKVMGRHEEAIQHLHAALRVHPRDVEMHIAQADVLVALGRDLEALRALHAARRPDPRHIGALERTARCAHRVGQVALAVDARRGWLLQRAQGARVSAFDADMKARGWAEARESDLRRELDDLMKRASVEDPFMPRGAQRQLSDDMLVVLADLGLWTEAMDCAFEGARRRPARLRLVLTDLPIDRRGFASDPRYAQMLRSAGLEELL